MQRLGKQGYTSKGTLSEIPLVSSKRENRPRQVTTDRRCNTYSLWVHRQVVVWKNLNTLVVDPVRRGWELQNYTKLRRLQVIWQHIAPQNLWKDLLQLPRKGDRQCQIMKCSCVKSGMICVAACGVCCGHCCNGEEKPDSNLASDEEDTC